MSMIPKMNNIEEIANEFVDTQIKESPIEHCCLYSELNNYVENIPDSERQQMLHRYNSVRHGHRDFDDKELETDLDVFVDDISRFGSDEFASELVKEVISNPKIGVRRMCELEGGNEDPSIWLFHNEDSMDKVLDSIHAYNNIMDAPE